MRSEPEPALAFCFGYGAKLRQSGFALNYCAPTTMDTLCAASEILAVRELLYRKVKMRLKFETDGMTGPLLRVWGAGWGEIAYVSFGFKGLAAYFEVPSDWHEHRRIWFHIGLLLLSVNFSFKWRGKVVPDQGQCSGPKYGFEFYDDVLWIHRGKETGRETRRTSIQMPWGYRNHQLTILSEKETHPYSYQLESGAVQFREATIYSERRQWTRPWLPWKKVRESIWVEFNDEVGERIGSWKGGTTACGWEMKPGETPLKTLRRMEAERVFN